MTGWYGYMLNSSVAADNRPKLVCLELVSTGLIVRQYFLNIYTVFCSYNYACTKCLPCNATQSTIMLRCVVCLCVSVTFRYSDDRYFTAE